MNSTQPVTEADTRTAALHRRVLLVRDAVGHLSLPTENLQQISVSGFVRRSVARISVFRDSGSGLLYGKALRECPGA